MPWEPLRELRAWQERLERLSAHNADAWTPPIDVYETDDHYVVSAELPGLPREQIDLAVEDARLTIRGRRSGRPPQAAEVLHFHQVERGHGAFARTFEFSAKIDIEARFGRPDRRRPHGHAPEGARRTASENRGPVDVPTHRRRDVVCVSSGLAAGLVLTGRMRTAEESAAASAHATARPLQPPDPGARSCHHRRHAGPHRASRSVPSPA